MELTEKIQHYKEHFKYDPLLGRIKSDGYEDELYENVEYFSAIEFTNSYSSRQAAQLLGLEGKEQTLLNFINRNDFQDYLNVLKKGRYYRYHWESIFKFKMLLLLVDKKFSPMDLAVIIGTVTETYIKKSATPQSYTEKLEIKEEMFRIAKEVTNESIEEIFHTVHSMGEYRQKKMSLELRLSVLSLRLDTVTDKTQVLKDNLEEAVEYKTFIETIKTNREESQQQGILARLFNRRVPDQKDWEDDNQERVLRLQRKETKINDSIKVLNEKKEQLKNEIEKVEIELGEVIKIPPFNQDKERMIDHETRNTEFLDND